VGDATAPGVVFHDSGAHMQTAGLMAIRATGAADWAEIFAAWQASTGLFPSGAYDLPSASNPRLAGGMHWTGQEYLDFLVALRDAAVLSDEMRAEMLANQRGDAIVAALVRAPRHRRGLVVRSRQLARVLADRVERWAQREGEHRRATRTPHLQAATRLARTAATPRSLRSTAGGMQPEPAPTPSQPTPVTGRVNPRRRDRAAAALLACAAACNAVEGAEPIVPRQAPAPQAPETMPIASPDATPPPPPPPIRLAFGGDVHGQSSIRDTLATGGNPFAELAPTLRAADLAMINLETVIGHAGRPESKRFVFRAPPSLLGAAVDAGVDVVSLGNNHAWDYGQAGLLATLGHVERTGLRAVGAGADGARANAPVVLEIGGVRVAVLGFSRVGIDWHTQAGPGRPGTANGFALADTDLAIASAARAADIVVVSVHMGSERRACPTARDRDFVERSFAAGASIIVGHHPHVLQGIELHGGKLVAYSLGNLVFDAHGHHARTTGVLVVTANADGRVLEYEWEPARIVGDVPIALHGAPRDAALADLAALGPQGSRCTGWMGERDRIARRTPR